MKVYAPGKLILSGEHAVVHGQPALAMAVNRYAIATVGRSGLPNVSLHLANLSHTSQTTFQDLLAIKDKLKRKYQKFIRGEYHIRDVLRKPFELVHAALGIIAGTQNIRLPDGMQIQVTSDIPIGSGMGSSAASILCVMKAASLHLQIPLSNDVLYQMALEAENLQHGQSSGLDLRVSLHGGCLYVHGNEMLPRPLPTYPFYLVNTGMPQCSTGECVKHVADTFINSSIGSEFAAVTQSMDQALQQQSFINAQHAVRANHQLLVNIGVVPERVRMFIEKVESLGGAAKISGAGAIQGDAAGMVMVLIQDEDILANLCRQFQYDLQTIQGEPRGVHVV